MAGVARGRREVCLAPEGRRPGSGSRKNRKIYLGVIGFAPLAPHVLCDHHQPQREYSTMSTTTGTRGRPVARLRRLALTSTTRAQHASHHLALLAAASATAIALMAASEPAAAQTAGNAATVPAAEAPRAYDIPAGPLGQTLVSIGQQSGRTISVDPALVAGRQAPAVRGSYHPRTGSPGRACGQRAGADAQCERGVERAGGNDCAGSCFAGACQRSIGAGCHAGRGEGDRAG